MNLEKAIRAIVKEHLISPVKELEETTSFIKERVKYLNKVYSTLNNSSELEYYFRKLQETEESIERKFDSCVKIANSNQKRIINLERRIAKLERNS